MRDFSELLLLHCCIRRGGCFDNSWSKLWLRLVAIKNCHYDLPSGSVGRDFVNQLSSEIDLLPQGSMRSERVLVFISTMLQQDSMVRKGTDICRLISRRLQQWKDSIFDELVTDSERCAR